jgi:DNA-binding NarL/FixJ family response regulator
MAQASRLALLVDPFPMWLDAVGQVVAGIGFEVAGKTTSAQEARALLEERGVALLVTGLDDGVDWLHETVRRHPFLRVVVLSGSDEPDAIADSFAAGAAAFVVKGAHPDDLAAAIRQVFAPTIYLRGQPSTAGSNRLSRPAALDLLTAREREILCLAAEGLSNARLAQQLWVTEQTVKFHLSNVYRKIQVTNRTEASRWAQVHGLLTIDSAAA